MIYGQIDYSSTLATLGQSEPWSEAMAWLRELTESSSLGITERHGGKMSLDVHTYRTKPREECRYENHRHTVDIQYTISGGECIEWALAGELEEDGEYQPRRDKQYFHVPTMTGSALIHMLPRHYSIFMADDAHCPKIHDGRHAEVFKAVVKIDTSLIAATATE